MGETDAERGGATEMRETHLGEWLKLSEADFIKCVSTAQGIDLKPFTPLQTRLQAPMSLCLPRPQRDDCSETKWTAFI